MPRIDYKIKPVIEFNSETEEASIVDVKVQADIVEDIIVNDVVVDTIVIEEDVEEEQYAEISFN